MNRYAFLAAASLLLTLGASGQEKTIDGANLSPAVQKTVQEQSKGATIKSYSSEREHGKKVYEAEMMADATRRIFKSPRMGS